MADYGIKVSRQGYDVKTCADNQLLFSSSFKMPMVLFSGLYSMGGANPSFNTNQDIFVHNLGFYPVTIVSTKKAGSSFQTLDTSENGRTGSTNEGLLITTSKLWYRANDWDSNVNYSYFITNIDLEQDYTAPNIITTTQSQSTINNNYGFKVSKSGNDVKTATLDQLASFSGSSSAGYPVRHQILHKVGGIVNMATNTTQTVAHGLGYPPMYLVYLQVNDGPNHYYYCFMSQYIVSGGAIAIHFRVWADGTNLNFFQDTGGNISLRYVIFKDPLF